MDHDPEPVHTSPTPTNSPEDIQQRVRQPLMIYITMELAIQSLQHRRSSDVYITNVHSLSYIGHPRGTWPFLRSLFRHPNATSEKLGGGTGWWPFSTKFEVRQQSTCLTPCMLASMRDNNGYIPFFKLHSSLHHTSLGTHPFAPIKLKRNVDFVHWE